MQKQNLPLRVRLKNLQKWWDYFGFLTITYRPIDDFAVGPYVFSIVMRSRYLRFAAGIHFKTSRYPRYIVERYRDRFQAPPRSERKLYLTTTTSKNFYRAHTFWKEKL